MSLNDTIQQLTSQSDIAFGSDAYEELFRELTDCGLNLAFFVFVTGQRSSCARTLSGSAVSCPVLTLYLKFVDDVRQTGMGPGEDNWRDQWPQTKSVRAALNGVLQRAGYGSDYVSEDTFVFVRAKEELAFLEIGRQCKEAVRTMVCAESPGVEVDRVFWNGRRYDVILRDEGDCKRVKPKVKALLAKALPKLLAAADVERCCQNYDVEIEFGHTGMNLFHLVREDC